MFKCVWGSASQGLCNSPDKDQDYTPTSLSWKKACEQLHMSVTEVASAGKCMKVRSVSSLHVAASQDASGRLITADHFCNISSHLQRPHIFTVSGQMQILSQLTRQATQRCCLCSEVTSNPYSSSEGLRCTHYTSSNETAQHEGKSTQ